MPDNTDSQREGIHLSAAGALNFRKAEIRVWRRVLMPLNQWGLPMNLTLFTAVTIFATAHIVAFVQNDDPSDQVPKPTLADVQNLVQTISRDKTKLQAYCKLGKLPDQMQKAEDRNHTKAVDALVAKADPLAQQIGPEYLKIVEGLEQVDPNSVEGQKLAAVFNSLREKCK